MPTKTRTLSDYLVTGGVSDIDTSSPLEGNPHIKLGVLQPAVAGKLLNGATHSGAYGTAQTQSGGDGHSYYYTDIKGSKPINDPRIGAHFGSQRYRITSKQILSDETGTHGKEVCSFDGREFFRGVGMGNIANDSKGITVQLPDNGFIEITGYFSEVNLMLYTYGYTRTMTISLDGESAYGGFNANSSKDTPLRGRYVHSNHVINIPLNSTDSNLSATPTLGIHTFKVFGNAGQGAHYPCGVELIAQDISSTANRSKIQIPAQSVISYGKEKSLSATAQHYDPFNGFTNSSDLHSAYVDTATSLGLDSAPGSSAKWAISGSNNIRPYNGMRVVKWIASDGTIKTSVNAIPPNAQNGLSNVAGTTEVTTPSATNTTPTPIFSDDAVDFSTSEAFAFHHREFGNGAGNGGTGAGGAQADVSMLNTNTAADDVAYTMDDGLTSFVGDAWTCNSTNESRGSGNNDAAYITFIGTGLSLTSLIDDIGVHNICSNLPYGTHVLRVRRTGSSNTDYVIDGIALSNVTQSSSGIGEIFIHQPKMPPVPKDACIIADYMLMADFVKQTDAEATQMSKGTRTVSSSRDIFYNCSATIPSLGMNANGGYCPLSGFTQEAPSSAALNAKLPFFGTTALLHAGNNTASITLNGSAVSEIHLDSSASTDGDIMAIDDGNVVPLGLNTIETTIVANYSIYGYQFQTPIRTSYSYQKFETPYTKELVGGDRNMEQTNLVVTTDGKSWDEVTRDTSYLSRNLCLSCVFDAGNSYITSSQSIEWNKWRGRVGANGAAVFDCVQKDWAISHNHVTCLVDGFYKIELTTYMHNSNGGKVHYNFNTIGQSSWGSQHKMQNNVTDGSLVDVQYYHFKRLDWLNLYFQAGGALDNNGQTMLKISRVS